MTALRSSSQRLFSRGLTLRRSYHASNVSRGGMTPPLPPFARSPARFEKMTENSDCLWDDGVAPELALDFDAPNMSSMEALYTLGGVLGFFTFVYQVLCKNFHPENPALPHATDVVEPDYSDYAAFEKAKEE